MEGAGWARSPRALPFRELKQEEGGAFTHMAPEVTHTSGVSQSQGLYTGNATPARGVQNWDGTSLPGMLPSQTLFTDQKPDKDVI